MCQIYMYYVVGACGSDLHLLCSREHVGQIYIYYVVGACGPDLHLLCSREHVGQIYICYAVGGMWVRSTFIM